MKTIDTQRTRVLMIAGSSFADATFTPLPGVIEDVLGLEHCLADPQLVGIPTNNVTVLRNPTSTQVNDYFFELQDDKESYSAIIFYYAGHGIMNSKGELYLATHDTTSKNFSSNALSTNRVIDTLNRSIAEIKLIILDCAFSGRLINNFKVNYLSGKNSTNLTVMASSLSSEPSVHSMGRDSFTSQFLATLKNGIIGHAEYISLRDIYSNVSYELKMRNLPLPDFYSSSTEDIAFSKNRQYQRIDPIQPSSGKSKDQDAEDSRKSHSVEENIGKALYRLETKLHSDSYNQEDADILGYDLHAFNLFSIMKDANTHPPVNIGILAPWGRGKWLVNYRIRWPGSRFGLNYNWRGWTVKNLGGNYR